MTSAVPVTVRMRLIDRLLGRTGETEKNERADQAVRRAEEVRGNIEKQTVKLIQLRKSYAKGGRRLVKK